MANFCSNCGTPLAPESKFCHNCGSKVVDSVQTPTPAPAPTPAAVPTPTPVPQAAAVPPPFHGAATPSSTGAIKVYVKYEGYFAAIDADIKLFVNGNQIGTYSFTKPFEVTVDVPSTSAEVKVKCWFRSAKINVEAPAGGTARVLLAYNRAWGSFKFIPMK